MKQLRSSPVKHRIALRKTAPLGRALGYSGSLQLGGASESDALQTLSGSLFATAAAPPALTRHSWRCNRLDRGSHKPRARENVKRDIIRCNHAGVDWWILHGCRLKSRAWSSDPFHGMLALQRATQRRWYKPVAFHRRSTKQATYCKQNIEARPCNHCCGGKPRSITYSECLSVALGIQHATRIRHIVTYGLPRCTVNSQFIS